MKKQFFFAAVAIVALASCADKEYVGDSPTPSPENGTSDAIVFNSGSFALTRADKTGAEAAEALNYKFVVGGFKGASSVATTTVFDNYNVEYTANTANTTESNTNNWEYVGLQPNALASIPHTATDVQTIKYWDYSQSQYDFIAYSLGTGGATVTAITPSTASDDGTDGAYKITGTTDQLKTVHIADLVTVKKADYSKVVNLTFRSMISKVRMALYETVPGYSVNNVKFYVSDAAINGGSNSATAALYTTGTATLPTKGTYTIYFPTINDETPASDKNKAHVAFTAASDGTQTDQTFGSLAYATAAEKNETAGTIYLGRASNACTYAHDATNADANHYIDVLPLEGGSSLTLKVDYTLTSIDGSGETIKVVGAKAVVPAIYAQWKPGYAYTYLFKISDNTNGYTSGAEASGEVAGLHPITFDAVVVRAEDNVQETITTVATPSITTYQVVPSTVTTDPASIITNNNEYIAGDVYAMVMDGGTLKTDLNGTTSPAKDAAKLYYLGTSDAASLGTKGTTEAEVMDALLMRSSETSGTITGRNGLVLAPQTSSIDNEIEAIPGADGNDITVNKGEASKLALTADASADIKYYAYVYTVSQADASHNVDKIEAAPLTTEPTGWPTGYYTDAACTSAATGTFAAGTYYVKYTVNDGKYAVKVIKVAK